jgi:hypothetical protein
MKKDEYKIKSKASFTPTMPTANAAAAVKTEAADAEAAAKTPSAATLQAPKPQGLNGTARRVRRKRLYSHLHLYK